jgi:hypothetical protein
MSFNFFDQPVSQQSRDNNLEEIMKKMDDGSF